MRRITIQVSDDAHRALKLLAILEAKPFGTVVQDALEFYLQHKNGYELDIVRGDTAEEPGFSSPPRGRPGPVPPPATSGG